MAEQTSISWTDSTFNPWIGCTKISPACDHCYAAAHMDTRLGRVEWGAGKPRQRTSAANWNLPLRWNARPFSECPRCRWRGEQPKVIDRNGGHIGWSEICLSCRAWDLRPARRRVFGASLADWLDNEVPIEWLCDLLDLIRRTPNLDWQLLTKRIGNWRSRLEQAAGHMAGIERKEWVSAWLSGSAPANVWIGATLANREEMLRDGPKLKRVPALVHFWSGEPLLGDLGEIPRELIPEWVICGGESGHGARPMHPDWVRGLRDQCAAAGVEFHFKQWGEWATVYDRDIDDPEWLNCGSVKHGTPRGRWLNIAGGHGFHGDRVVRVDRVGKRASGRLLDGVEHNGMPVVRDE